MTTTKLKGGLYYRHLNFNIPTNNSNYYRNNSTTACYHIDSDCSTNHKSGQNNTNRENNNNKKAPKQQNKTTVTYKTCRLSIEATYTCHVEKGTEKILNSKNLPMEGK